LVAVVLTLSIHLHKCQGGWTESTNERPQTYPDCPLTLSIDYNQKANLDKYEVEGDPLLLSVHPI